MISRTKRRGPEHLMVTSMVVLPDAGFGPSAEEEAEDKGEDEEVEKTEET